MKIRDIPVPDIYKESQDFRFFQKWFEYALSKTQYDTTNLIDLYDPLRCPESLLGMLGDTMGYQFDDRLCTAFNRFAMIYFMTLIHYKGSSTGVTLAAEVNLKQKDINAYGEENDILYNRLEDTSLPVNSVYVESDVDEGLINIVYFTDKKPIDSCIEYVRPLGMYCFQYAGVRVDSNTRISVDARLAKANDATGTIGPTKVGKYSRNDYGRLQKMKNESKMRNNVLDKRTPVYSNSSTIGVSADVNAGYRAMSSLQLTNNEHIVKSLINFDNVISDVETPTAPDYCGTKERPTIFALGRDLEVNTFTTDWDAVSSDPRYNLLYNRTDDAAYQRGVYTIDDRYSDGTDRPTPSTPSHPNPRINDGTVIGCSIRTYHGPEDIDDTTGG